MTDDVRPAEFADADRLGEVHVRVWRETYADLMPADYLAALSPIDSAARWRARIADPAPGTVTFVATSDGMVVGFATAGPTRDEPPEPPDELYAVNLLAAHHGTGLGARLFVTAVDAAAAGRAVSLWVARGNERACAFYRKHGFAPDGRLKAHHGTGLTEERWVRPATES